MSSFGSYVKTQQATSGYTARRVGHRSPHGGERGGGPVTGYYCCWLAALERVLDDTGVLSTGVQLDRPRILDARPSGHDRDHGDHDHNRPAQDLSVYATWKGEYRCRVRACHHEIRADEPLKAGGDNSGPQPTE